MTFPSYASIARSLAFAVGLSSVGCASYTGVMPPVDEPGLTVTGRSDADLATSLRVTIERDYHVSGIQVGDVSSFMTQLDGDGVANDFAGSALFQNGRRFRSIIFLMREDGSTRFLEANGARFDPASGGSFLSCDSKPVACPDSLERAARRIRRARFHMAEMDSTRPGLEVVIPYDDGRSGILNSLELFASR
jgi:hypothetical protein